MRARNIKPGFFKNELLAQCNPFARILFSGLWCLADKDGRLEDRPLRIKAEILPFDQVDVDALLNELSATGFILRYVQDNLRVLQVVKFSIHQHTHRDERSYGLPPPCAENGKSPEIPVGLPPKSPSFLDPSCLNPSCSKEEIAPSCSAASEPSLRPQSPAAKDDQQQSHGMAQATQSATEDPTVMTFPVVGGKATEWCLREAKIAEYR